MKGKESMKVESKYMLAKIARALKSGRAWMTGTVCSGARWPEGDHYYIIDGNVQGYNETYHVDVTIRPTWGRYLKGAE